MTTASARALFQTVAQGAATAQPSAALSDLLTRAAEPLVSAHPRPVWRAVLREVVADNFRDISICNALFSPPLELVEEGMDYPFGDLEEGIAFSATGHVRKYGRAVAISRELAVNDRSMGFLADLINAMTAAAYRKEADEFFSALNANGNLDDGAPWFDASNSVSAASVAVAIMNGLAALRAQTFPDGQATHSEPYALLVPHDWHVELQNIDADFMLKPPIILRSASLTAGYAFADPAFVPSVALVGLRPGVMPEIMMSNKNRHTFARELFAIAKARHEFAIVPLSRVGVVKMTSTGP